jgi:hypothetical protein
MENRFSPMETLRLNEPGRRDCDGISSRPDSAAAECV